MPTSYTCLTAVCTGKHWLRSPRLWTSKVWSFHSIKDMALIKCFTCVFPGGVGSIQTYSAWTGTWTLDPQIKSLMLYRLSYPGSRSEWRAIAISWPMVKGKLFVKPVGNTFASFVLAKVKPSPECHRNTYNDMSRRGNEESFQSLLQLLHIPWVPHGFFS